MNPLDQLDPDEQRKAKAADALRRRREEDDFRWLMNDKRGRRVVWRLLENTGVYKTSFTGNSETFFREGQRNVGLMLISQIHELTPEAYVLMLNEARSK